MTTADGDRGAHGRPWCTQRRRQRRSWTVAALPLPFGVQPYYKPEVPRSGTVPYKAIMATEPGLSAHVAYYPANLRRWGTKKIPVLIWGNGSCLDAGNRYRQFLTEIASHGYLVVAGGPMGAVEFEVVRNPIPRQLGSSARGAGPAPPPAKQAAERHPARPDRTGDGARS